MQNVHNNYKGIEIADNQSKETGTKHPYNLRQAMKDFERGYLQNMLILNNWDVPGTANILGIAPETLRAKMEKFHLSNVAINDNVHDNC
jgi:DNA-binding NtrC family response regulator